MILKLLEVQVQPVFVAIADDGSIRKLAEPHAKTIPAADWPGFPTVLESLRVETEAALSQQEAETLAQREVDEADAQAREALALKDRKAQQAEARKIAAQAKTAATARRKAKTNGGSRARARS